MRYGNWDVLLFQSGSRVPIQEFGVSCFHCFDPELYTTLDTTSSEDQRNNVANGTTNVVDVQYLTQTVPTVTGFIATLPHQTPFHISLHCWSNALNGVTRPERNGQQINGDMDEPHYELRVLIDNVRESVMITPIATTTWPFILDARSNSDGSEGPRRPLQFPEFLQEYIEREWTGISGTGRINVILSEGVSGTQPYRRLRNLVAFSFVYAPTDVLEWAGISFPRTTFNATRAPNLMLPSLATYLRRSNGPSSRNSIDRPFPLPVFQDRTAEIVNNAATNAPPTASPSTEERTQALNRPAPATEFAGGIANRRGLSLRMRIVRPGLTRSATVAGGEDGNPFMGFRRNIPNLQTQSANNTPTDLNETIAILRAEIDTLRVDNQLLSRHLETVTGTRWSPGSFQGIPVPPVTTAPARSPDPRPPLASRNSMPYTRGSPTIPEMAQENRSLRRERSVTRFMQSPSSLGIETPSGELGTRDPFEEFIDFSALASSSPAGQAPSTSPFVPQRSSRLRSESAMSRERENSWLLVDENVAPSPSRSVLGSLGGSVVTTPQAIPEGQRQLGHGLEQTETGEDKMETPRMAPATLARPQ